MKKMLYIFIVLTIFSLPLNAQVAVIANKSVPVDEISNKQLLDFYTGDIRIWSDDNPVVVFPLPEPPTKPTMLSEGISKETSSRRAFSCPNSLTVTVILFIDKTSDAILYFTLCL